MEVVLYVMEWNQTGLWSLPVHAQRLKTGGQTYVRDFPCTSVANGSFSTHINMILTPPHVQRSYFQNKIALE